MLWESHLKTARPISHRVKEACNILGGKKEKERGVLKEDFHYMHWGSERNGSKSLKQKSKVGENAKEIDHIRHQVQLIMSSSSNATSNVFVLSCIVHRFS